MLVLTRKPGETILIGKDVIVTVLKTGRGSIRLGIDAPNSVPILRGELKHHLKHSVEERETDAAACPGRPPDAHISG